MLQNYLTTYNISRWFYRRKGFRFLNKCLIPDKWYDCIWQEGKKQKEIRTKKKGRKKTREKERKQEKGKKERKERKKERKKESKKKKE